MAWTGTVVESGQNARFVEQPAALCLGPRWSPRNLVDFSWTASVVLL